MNEVENKKAIERANSYREMMNLWAWKDFMKILNDLKVEAMSSMEETPIEDVSVAKTAKYLGFIEAFRKIEGELGFILEAYK